MLHIGCHLSASQGYCAMGNVALSIGADTFQFFTRNPRGGAAKPLDHEDASAFMRLAREHDFAVILAHAPYTLNACSADARTRQFAFEVMQDDLIRLEATPNQMYNFHPGSHVGQGVEAGIALIADLLNRTLTRGQTTTVLLETMAGKGSEVGG
ncbi:MAG: TIM barrel protein, partial [Clostridia bacterium]|nr:TIM barrel protein [Clostridia bacterium]